MKQKILLLFMLVLLFGGFSYAQVVLPPGVKLPDNIINANCYITPPVQNWSIEEVASVSNTSLSVFQSPIVGDLDGDGIPEIAVINGANNAVVIFNGRDLSVPDRTVNCATLNAAGTALGAARIKMNDGSFETLLFIIENNSLRAYNYRTSSFVWTVPAGYGINAVAPFGFVDFNNDGFVEIYIGNVIIDAATGNRLGQVSKIGYSPMMIHPSYITAVGDVLNNGSVQFIVANQVYSVAINRVTYTATFTLEKELNLSSFTMPNGAAPPNDGNTIIVDLDLDGNLDVLVVYSPYTTGGTMQMYVWTPATNSVLVRNSVSGVAKRGIPLIGDIDGDGYSEIVFITGYTAGDVTHANDYIRAFKYIPNNSALSQIWTLPHTDRSGFTGLTLFDFNQDGKSELVYRDETDLRIINASGVHHVTGLPVSMPYNLAQIICVSATRAEMPVIADIDNDGHAEIITVGTKTGSFSMAGPLRVFKGPVSSPWAPARPVWNQTAYNAVYVNKDLTIPGIPMNQSTLFPGDGGIFGDGNDVHPFNNFLQQSTMLDMNGEPLWLTPKGEIIDEPVFTYNGGTDEMTISIDAKKTGSIK